MVRSYWCLSRSASAYLNDACKAELANRLCVRLQRGSRNLDGCELLLAVSKGGSGASMLYLSKSIQTMCLFFRAETGCPPWGSPFPIFWFFELLSLIIGTQF